MNLGTKTVHDYRMQWAGGMIVAPRGLEFGRVVHAELTTELTIWVEMLATKDETTLDVMKLELIGTGQYIPESYSYVDTFIHPPFVWHLYETGSSS